MVELTQELLNKMFEYEPATGRLIWKDYPAELEPSNQFLKSFKKRFLGEEAGYISKEKRRQSNYRIVHIKGKNYKAHRLIWCIVYGKYPIEGIDHINHNGEDNSLKNLRAASNADNRKNLSLSRANKSGVTGVCWHKQAKKWAAQVMYNGKKRHLGYYVSLEEAAQVAKKAREELGFHPNHGV